MRTLLPLLLAAAGHGTGGWLLVVLIVAAVAVAAFFLFRGHAEGPGNTNSTSVNRSPRDSGWTNPPDVKH